ncbi:hypothetical protein ANN_17325 [Periplaneta americana]|uniref:Uncharacterized protein n=1 Tax=Periplaneta americana TaxID=6978 RepID=A0ABQ8SUR1_PERAM|nr:hypothetical protein ANN_17325 [Periplaneta americana]
MAGLCEGGNERLGSLKASKRLRWAGHVAHMRESKNAYRVLVGRPEGKRPLGRPRRRWEDNIKIDLREVGYDDRDWIGLGQDRDLWRAYCMYVWEERKLLKLVGSLAGKKLRTERCTGRNGEQENSSEQKKISDDRHEGTYVAFRANYYSRGENMTRETLCLAVIAVLASDLRQPPPPHSLESNSVPFVFVSDLRVAYVSLETIYESSK